MAAPGRVDARVGLSVGTQQRFADVLKGDRERLLARAVANEPKANATTPP